MSTENTELASDGKIKRELADRFLVTAGLAKDLKPQDRAAFTELCVAFGLNPFQGEIWAVPQKGGGLYIHVGVNTYRKRAERHPAYDGYEIEMNWHGPSEADDSSCTCVVYRKDRPRPTKTTTYFIEATKRQALWATAPRMMLEKTATARGLRHAFPDECAGLPYTPEEIGSEPRDVTSRSSPSAPEDGSDDGKNKRRARLQAWKERFEETFEAGLITDDEIAAFRLRARGKDDSALEQIFTEATALVSDNDDDSLSLSLDGQMADG